jgi:hypothetical protein
MGTQVAQSLLTKFFYSGNRLHFQIFIQTENDLDLFGEYSDYALYKTAFELIQFKLLHQIRVFAPTEKKTALETDLAIVA